MSFRIKPFPHCVGALVVVLGLGAGDATAQEPAAGVLPEASEIEALQRALEPYVMPKSGPFRPDEIEISNKNAIADWARSAHADARAEAFAHWNAEGEVPPACAVCHSGAGFRSFHGLDGTAAGPLENPVPVGGVVDCDTCHNPGISEVKAISMPSGVVHPVEPAEASCLTCHQGRSAGATVEKAVAGKAEDLPDDKLRFINPHYKVAAAVWLGGYGGAGYQYPGKEYSGRFIHVPPLATCVSCHEPHRLEVSEQVCLICHQMGKPTDIRLSRISYDGSGNLKKGISADIAANAERLMGLLIDYAGAVAGTPIIYDGNRHPYFFADANGDGRIDEAEGRPVAYNAWTPRLLKAAYNWKFVTADPGVFVHNPHYALELLFDSTEDLAGALGRDFAAWGLQR